MVSVKGSGFRSCEYEMGFGFKGLGLVDISTSPLDMTTTQNCPFFYKQK
jgi:hypothetical protein